MTKYFNVKSNLVMTNDRGNEWSSWSVNWGVPFGDISPEEIIRDILKDESINLEKYTMTRLEIILEPDEFKDVALEVRAEIELEEAELNLERQRWLEAQAELAELRMNDEINATPTGLTLTGVRL